MGVLDGCNVMVDGLSRDGNVGVCDGQGGLKCVESTVACDGDGILGALDESTGACYGKGENGVGDNGRCVAGAWEGLGALDGCDVMSCVVDLRGDHGGRSGVT